MKHERAGLVLLSYIIGFTTAFIAYGLQLADSLPIPVLTESTGGTQVASVVATNETQSVEETPATAYETEEGLVLERAGEVRLVAASAAYAPELGDDAYTSLEAQVLSGNGEYLFFCITTPSVSDSCFPYVYDWQANGLRAVTVGGELGNFPIGELNSAWSSDGYLQVGRYLSTSPETPWNLE